MTASAVPLFGAPRCGVTGTLMPVWASAMLLPIVRSAGPGGVVAGAVALTPVWPSPEASRRSSAATVTDDVAPASAWPPARLSVLGCWARSASITVGRRRLRFWLAAGRIASIILRTGLSRRRRRRHRRHQRLCRCKRRRGYFDTGTQERCLEDGGAIQQLAEPICHGIDVGSPGGP